MIGGHLLNLAINALGSFIHTSRLQYIEFYNRFYEGGGKFSNLSAIKHVTLRLYRKTEKMNNSQAFVKY